MVPNAPGVRRGAETGKTIERRLPWSTMQTRPYYLHCSNAIMPGLREAQ
jgi:hypothetical protein